MPASRRETVVPFVEERENWLVSSRYGIIAASVPRLFLVGLEKEAEVLTDSWEMGNA